MYTNANGTYLGDPSLNPVFSVLNERQATVFVHPAAPGCQSVSLGYPFPLTEYPFDSVRAMENLLLKGQRAENPNIKMIFAHGGGAMPYLASRIAGMASMSLLGSLNMTKSLAELAGYYFDTASATSAIQLAAMKSFIGVDQILTGTDCKPSSCFQHSCIQSMRDLTMSQTRMFPLRRARRHSLPSRATATSPTPRWRASTTRMRYHCFRALPRCWVIKLFLTLSIVIKKRVYAIS